MQQRFGEGAGLFGVAGFVGFGGGLGGELVGEIGLGCRGCMRGGDKNSDRLRLTFGAPVEVDRRTDDTEDERILFVDFVDEP